MTSGFESHLILKFFGCPKDVLLDKKAVFEALDKLSAKLKFAKPKTPLVFKAQDNELSGVMLAHGSHAAIHAFSNSGQVFIDIFSSREFDASIAVGFLFNMFQPEKHEVELAGAKADFSGKEMFSQSHDNQHVFGSAGARSYN